VVAKSVEIREITNGFIIRTTTETEHPDGRLGCDVTEEFSPTNPLKERGPSVVGAKEPIVGPPPNRMAAIVND
jgi:hypothetical protein